MKAVFAKLKILWAALRAFVITYGIIVAGFWGVVEPLTHFKEKFLKQWLGWYWWIVIYIVPVPIALIAATITHRKASHPKFLDEFKHKTRQIINKAQLTITGTGRTIEKREVPIVESQLKLGRPVLITGDAGTGKSGVGVVLARRAENNHTAILFIDARQVQHLQDENALRQFYLSEKPLQDAIDKLGVGFRLVIDQLDNTVDKPIAHILIDLAIECSKIPRVQVIVVSRRREAHEVKLLNNLLDNNFVEIECRQLDDVEVKGELQELGFENPNANFVSMCRNLLNLEIISRIKTANPAFEDSDFEDEVTLWDAYLDTLQDRESNHSNYDNAEMTLSEAMKLAKDALAADGQVFTLDNPLSPSRRRLVSWGIIERVDGVTYRFKHEKLQDYLFAKYAADHRFMPVDVLRTVGPIRSRNTSVWLVEIYRHTNSPLYIQYLKEVFYG